MKSSTIHELIRQLLGPALEVSLDPVAITDEQARVVYSNAAMRAFLGLKARDVREAPRFQELLSVPSMGGACPVVEVIRTGEPIRYDEEPALKRDGTKLRMLFKCVPLSENVGKEEGVHGAILSLRDTSAEILLQAKYHKLHSILEEKDAEISEVRTQLKSLLASLRSQRRD